MAGSVEHLAVTIELLHIDKKEDGSFLQLKNPIHFALGNLAPDGIMSRKGYTRPMKMHTHFRDGIPDWEFTAASNLQLFHQRIRQFSEEMLSDSSLDRDLYLGYITHILTDEIFMKTVRPEFMKKIAVLGLTDRDAKTFEHFTYDVNQIDFRLGREYSGMDEMKGCLLCEDDCSIREMRGVSGQEQPEKTYHIQTGTEGLQTAVSDMITSQELTDSREWVRNFFFDQAPMPEKPVYYTYERALRFIEEAAIFIKDHLPEYICSEEGK